MAYNFLWSLIGWQSKCPKLEVVIFLFLYPKVQREVNLFAWFLIYQNGLVIESNGPRILYAPVREICFPHDARGHGHSCPCTVAKVLFWTPGLDWPSRFTWRMVNPNLFVKKTGADHLVDEHLQSNICQKGGIVSWRGTTAQLSGNYSTSIWHTHTHIIPPSISLLAALLATRWRASR